MLSHHLKLAIRNFLRFKTYSFINLFGLSIGLTTSILILIYVNDELSFDAFHVNQDRVYKVVTNSQNGEMETNGRPVGYKLLQDFPEVEDVTYSIRASTRSGLLHEGKLVSHNMFYSDPSFFNIFSFPVLSGKKENMLAAPNSIVITDKIRDIYFDKQDVIGETLLFNDSIEYAITGVVNIPEQSHIQFDILISLSSIVKDNSKFDNGDGWGTFDMRNYILLKEGVNKDELALKASPIYFTYNGEWMEEMGVKFTVGLVPLKDVYLSELYNNGFGPSGSESRIKLVSLIGVLVLVLACINFINLTTSRSVYRAREVGVKKINGSSFSGLFWQFQFETFFQVVLAMIVSVMFVELSLPLFNSIMGKTYSFSALLTNNILLGYIVLIIFVSVFSGGYPALILAKMKGIDAVKGKFQNSSRGSRLRKVLVTLQFSISAAMVLGALLVLSQLDYMQSKELGFAKDQILIIDGTKSPKISNPDLLNNQFKSVAGVEAASFTNSVPGRPGWLGQWAYPNEIDTDSHVDTEYMAIDQGFIDVLGLELIAGNNFDLENPAQLKEGLIINETCVREMGWESPEDAIGKRIVSPSTTPQGTVIGVVKDYHGLGLQDRIWAQAMDYSSKSYGRYYALRFGESTNIASMIDQLETVWEVQHPDSPMEYFFLDQDFNRQYQAEERLMTVFIIFSILAITLATIGLVGMASFTIENKMKEISVRKIHGASTSIIVRSLSQEFLILVIIANMLIVGPTWYFAQEWLSGFAFRADIQPMPFILALALMIGLTLLTISFQIFRAASTNPAHILRNE